MRRSYAALEAIREFYLACRRVFNNRATQSESKSHGLLVCLENSVFRNGGDRQSVESEMLYRD
jgi:hypothetical protein